MWMRLNFILLELVELMDDDCEAYGFECCEHYECDCDFGTDLHSFLLPVRGLTPRAIHSMAVFATGCGHENG